MNAPQSSIAENKNKDVPVFEPLVPAYMLDALSESERYLIRAINIIEQQNKWLIEQKIEQNIVINDHEYRLLQVEDWKKVIVSKAGLVIGGFTLFLTVGLSEIIKWGFGFLTGSHK